MKKIIIFGIVFLILSSLASAVNENYSVKDSTNDTEDIVNIKFISPDNEDFEKLESKKNKLKAKLDRKNYSLVEKLTSITRDVLKNYVLIEEQDTEDLTIILEKTNTSAPIQNAECYLDVWLPNRTKTVDNTQMIELSQGYYYNIINWTEMGNYSVLVRCVVDSQDYYSSAIFTIGIEDKSKTDDKAMLDSYDDLQNIIYPAVANIELKLNQTLANQSSTWNNLAEIHNNITTIYNEIINTENQLTALDDSMASELADHKNRLIAVNNTVNQLLNNFTQEVNPKLEQLKTDVDLIKDYTDELEAEQNTIENISAVKSIVDVINSNTNHVEKYIDSLENTFDCDGINDILICDKLDIIDLTLAAIYKNTNDLEARLASIIDYVDNLESGQQITLNAVTEIKDMLNCSTTITSGVCWKLDLIQSYTNSLESGQTTITDDLGSLLENQGILAKLNAIISYVNTVGIEITNLDNAVQNLDSTMDIRFDAIDSNLNAISTEIQTILADQSAINASQAALLNQILVLAKITTSTVDWIEDDLNTPIIVYLEDTDAILEEDINATVENINTTVEDTVEDLNDTVEEINTTIENTNTTVTVTYDLLIDLNTTISSIYTTTQNILSKWDKYTIPYIFDILSDVENKINSISSVINNTAISNLEAIVNAAKDEIGFKGKSLTAYEYFVKLESELIRVNTTLLNRIEFEANAPVDQILDTIQVNTNEIFSEINTSENNIDDILTKWESYSASNIINDVTANRNKLIEFENWLNAFNHTEARRHDESKSLIKNILSWFGVSNKEAQRHNLTQSKIDNIFVELDNTNNLCNNIIALLGYSGKNSTVYDKLVSLFNQNNQITALAQEINLTANQTYNILFTVNETIELVYTNTQDILTKWDKNNVSSIIEQLNIINIRLNVVKNTTNDTAVLNDISNLKAIINATRNELKSEGKSLTAYRYIVQLESELFSVNAILFNEIEFEADTIINNLNENEGILLKLLNKWDNSTADDAINIIVKNRNKLITMEKWLIAFNQTEEIWTDNESQNFITKILSWLGVSKEEEIIQKDDDIVSIRINEAITSINKIKILSNDIIAILGYGETGINVYNNTLKIMDLLAVIIAETGNLTGINFVELGRGSNTIALPKQPSDTSIEAVMSNITDKFTRVDHYNTETQKWEVYVPDAPFGNTLKTMETKKVYWIFATERGVLYIS